MRSDRELTALRFPSLLLRNNRNGRGGDATQSAGVSCRGFTHDGRSLRPGDHAADDPYRAAPAELHELEPMLALADSRPERLRHAAVPRLTAAYRVAAGLSGVGVAIVIASGEWLLGIGFVVAGACFAKGAQEILGSGTGRERDL